MSDVDLLEHPTAPAPQPQQATNRFNVHYWAVPRGLNRGRFHGYQATGWVVRDGCHRITIIFATKDEAQRRRDNVEKIYARFGW